MYAIIFKFDRLIYHPQIAANVCKLKDKWTMPTYSRNRVRSPAPLGVIPKLHEI